MQEITTVLKDLGLTQRESEVYLTLLRQETLAAATISKEANIDRALTYDILQKLMAKGIVSVSTRNGTKQFSALRPKELLRHYRDKYASLERIMPRLESFTSATKEPATCELFVGKEGLKTVCRDLIGSRGDYKVIGIRHEYEEILGFLNDQGIIELDSWRVRETAIVEKGVKFKKLKSGKYKYISKRLISPVTTLIYSDVVLFFVWTAPYFAVRIKSKELARAQEEYFQLLWDS